MRKPRYPALRLLRRLGAGRRTAKAIYKASGYLAHVKTPRRTYTVDLDDGKPATTFAGWRWMSCNPSMALMDLSMQLDWDHWDHWACVHDDCDRPTCAECGGVACPIPEDFEDDA